MTPPMPGWFRWLLVPLAAVGASWSSSSRSARWHARARSPRSASAGRSFSLSGARP